MESGGPTDGTLKSVRTAMEVIQLLRDEEGIRVSELADELDISRSTAHRYLKTLHRTEFITKDGDTYRVGLRFLSFGSYVRSRLEGYEILRKKAEELAADTGERVQFVVPEHDKAVSVYRAMGERAVKLDFRVGDRVPLHTISAGKAVLAAWPADRVDRYVEENELVAYTDNTIADPAELREELDRIRRDGYSVSRQEFAGELNAVGVAVETPDGGILGGLSISGPTHRMTGDRLEDTIPDLLEGTAREIVLNLQYSD